MNAINKLYNDLEAAGFNFYPNHLKGEENTCDWIASRRLEGAVHCDTNEHKISLHVKPCVFTMGKFHHESVALEIVGEAGGMWYNLQAYSFKPDDVMLHLDKAEASLLAAWNILHRG